MSLRDHEMFDMPFTKFCRLMAETPADDPPGAIAAAAAALAVAAALTEKCVQASDAAKLANIATFGLELAAHDADAYRRWRDGDEDSPAIVKYPETLSRFAEDLAAIIDGTPAHPVTGDTDLRAAHALAMGAAKAARLVAEGNQAHPPASVSGHHPKT